jgi:NAD(P)-dependent dehydrogenase (short-subunit alcohol dehydrogenase family)
MSAKRFFDLTGRVALVTGGSRGLGLQCAIALGDFGAKIAITARKEHELEEAAVLLKNRGISVITVSNDLQSSKGVPDLVNKVMESYGGIDILINNAGATWGAAAEAYPPEAWRKVMALNVDSLFFLSQEVGKRAMIPKNYGKIINISSIAGLGGNPDGMSTIAYNTSKGAVMNFTRALACEWGKYNINVNTICPGFFPTKMSVGLLAKNGFEEAVLKATPLKRLGGDEDLMGTAVFLASDASRHITGQYIAVDGGTSAVV